MTDSQTRRGGRIGHIMRADTLLCAVETPHPLVECATEALARGDLQAAKLHIESMVVHRDADQRRLRRAAQSIVCALEGSA